MTPNSTAKIRQQRRAAFSAGYGRGAARLAIARVAAKSDLSSGVCEVVERALAAG